MKRPGGTTLRRAAIARGLLALAAAVLLPLAALLQLPRQGAAQSAGQDSLWVGWHSMHSDIGVCGNPSSPAALASCFSTTIDAQGVDILAMATDGVNVYYAGKDGGLSCPIADLGANCTHIMAGPWGDDVTSLAAEDGQIWIGQKDGKIYRCPANLPYTSQSGMPASCLLLDDAGNRSVDSLLLANGRLYAGLSQVSGPYQDKDHGILWSCDPQNRNGCNNLDTYGNTTANSLAAGGGYLWAGLENGIIWRCSLNATNACANWDDAGDVVNSISYDGQGALYAAIYNPNNNLKGTIWTCSTATANGCSDLLTVDSAYAVAAGAGSVFSSTSSFKMRNGNHDAQIHFGTEKFDLADEDANPLLLYIPAAGPAGVGGVEVNVSAGALGQKLGNRCEAGRNPKAIVTVEGPQGFSKTLKVGACGLVKGGTHTRTLDLLDPGAYTVTVQAFKRRGQVRFTIEENTTKPVNVTLARGSNGG
ncbi:MAG: hypothetical protein ACR2J8_02200 [Thermomicrobiales bacterium]